MRAASASACHHESMSSVMGPDWKALAAAQKVELGESQLKRLEDLSRTMLGLRGMIDWMEQPAISFRLETPGDESR